jgi:hypothetical protein
MPTSQPIRAARNRTRRCSRDASAAAFIGQARARFQQPRPSHTARSPSANGSNPRAYRYLMKPAVRRANLSPASFSRPKAFLRQHLRRQWHSGRGRVRVDGAFSFVVTWTIYTHLFAQNRDEWADRLTAPSASSAHTVIPL